MRHALVATVLWLASPPVTWAAASAALTPAEKQASAAITEASLRGPIRFLSHDLLEGRGPATRGDALTQQYLVSEFETLGLKPAAPDGSYLQPFDLVGVNGHPQTLVAAGGGKRLELKYSGDFIAVSGHQGPESTLRDAELVFVGYGIVAPEYNWDDFKGTDLKGKVLVMMNNDPEADPALFGGKTRLWYGRWDYKYTMAEQVGAAGAIIIHTQPSAGYPWQVVQTSWAGEQFELPVAPKAAALQVRAWATEEASRALVGLAGKDLDALRAEAQKREFRPVPLGVRLNTSFKSAVQRKKTANVLAVLPGSDPKLAAEVVVYSAHHDHLGVRTGAKPGEDDIYNGAEDNASGVAALLSIARAYTRLPKPPKRSVLFAAVAAEEQGLLGSEYLTAHPPVPAGAMAANINIDGANIWGKTRDVTFVGLGKSSLDAWVTSLAATQGRVVKADPMPDRGFFYRSDQFNFAKLGVP
ncbi:MAG TPA: M28 family peptidase, partial [Myxococcaceae bacterium]|nr:M28 family peptidase [Myxococcaceae bacterium]